MKRRIFLALFLAAALVGLTTGCAKASARSKTVQPQAWSQKILKSAKFTDHLTELGQDAALRRYSANLSDISSFDAYVGTGATAEEFSVWQMRDEKSAQALVKNIRALIAAQKNSYADYRPAEVPKLQSAIVEQKGDGVVMCICADNAAAGRMIDGLFCGK